MVGGGFYEPILISIPSADQHEQIVQLADYVEQHFGKRPSGAWLAERVWEPQLASVLAEAEVAYTVLDDIHFLSAGFEQDELVRRLHRRRQRRKPFASFLGKNLCAT